MLKEDIPERFHLKNNRRVMDVFAYGDEGWTITEWNATVLQRFGDKGDHGYDNTLDSMKPFFIAQGPAFKQGASVEPIQNVDIYPLICFLLEIEPSANNGSLTRAKLLLNDKYLNGADLKTDCNFAFVTLFAFIVVHIRPFI
ncbi:ectonucleotide pyrophosphatase/phosphodiesterase family member 5 [Plakobranchus ocellatus]|uniref:Ectonucleotide pyrophosphatase/phosphodiesterase family member 5 n=1 Tax=Plakobranchus ocellatus TaxID=259542 RepID=A0AAV4BDK3_9GAST|nr:ectonucleotide pyrophosphatase/phosphodiesterase family member 5 [Plakobranchus ocellatus]